ncbi:MAG: CDP-alcohol phosphatidyltransferase family protein [Myxococcaceae bacterium]|nr:CDP-alcohol phosphatidyltransferase family protein [Myxococcaceae bacterium]
MPPWVPNAISLVRVLLVPVWVWLAVEARAAALVGQPPGRTTLVAVLLALGASDVVDGFIARRWKLTSNLGATLDAVADKLAQVATVTFLAFWGPPAFTPLPWWLWAALVLRDGALAVGFALV